MSKLDDFNAWLTANPDPNRRKWVNEVLVRGRPEDGTEWGVVNGSHFIFGVDTLDPFGKRVTALFGPFSASEVPQGDDTPFSQIVGIVVIQQQATIDRQAATISSLRAELAAVQGQP